MRWPLRLRPAGRRGRGRGVPERARADHMRIAVLEHDLLGIQPTPGTVAAAAVNLRNAARFMQAAMAHPVDPARCPHEEVVETTQVGDARSRGLCTRCGVDAVEDDDGAWTFPL